MNQRLVTKRMILVSACVMFLSLVAPQEAMARAVFNYLTSPVDVTPTTTGAWTDVDVSSYIAPGATGVIVQGVNTGASAENFWIRHPDSTDDKFGSGAAGNQQGWLMCGVNESGVFQFYQGSTYATVVIYLVGYTMPGVKGNSYHSLHYGWTNPAFETHEAPGFVFLAELDYKLKGRST